MKLFRFLSLAGLGLFLVGCEHYSFTDVQGYYSKPGNVELTFRVINAETGESPDLIGKNISKYIQVLEDDEILSNDEGRSIEMGNAKSVRLKTLLVLDLSGSVSKSLSDLQEAAEVFVSKVVSNSNIQAKIGIMTFDGSKDLELVQDFTGDRDALMRAIRGLHPGKDPSTNLYGAIQNSYEVLNRETFDDDDFDQDQFNSIDKKALVFFTDGKDRAGRVSESDARRAIEKARNTFALVSAVVVGSEIEFDFLEAFGTKYQGYFPVNNYSALAGAFEKVTLQLQRMGGSYFQVRICSPKRRGIHYINLRTAPQFHFGHPDQEFNEPEYNVQFNANGFTGGCDVKDDSQWKRSGLGHASAVLTDSEVELYHQFFARFDRMDSHVIFKSNAIRPEGASAFIPNFSPYSRESKVNCHLRFLGDAGNISQGEEVPVVRYGSYSGIYSDTHNQFRGFYLDLSRDQSAIQYTLQCFPFEEMIYSQARYKGHLHDPERYVLKNIDVQNGLF